MTSSLLVQEDLVIAAEYWGVSPAQVAAKNRCLDFTVEVGPLTSPEPAIAEADEPGCWIRLSPLRWTEFQPYSPTILIDCVMIVHEYGHATGHPHVSDPSNVMYPALSAYSVPGCTAAFAPAIAQNVDAEIHALSEQIAQQHATETDEAAALIRAAQARRLAIYLAHKRYALRYARHHRHHHHR